jgi:Gly-Xaa carboxypeptidase
LTGLSTSQADNLACIDPIDSVSDYLNKTFPRVYETLSLEKVNTHGIVLTWEGSDSSLKPTLFTGHVDVVPVEPETLDNWTHPPFEGHYDGTYLWGRGSVDDKHAVSAALEAVSLLIEKQFIPRRTLILAFGFDEESKGRNGAGHISAHLAKKYGKDGIAVLVDEGGLGIGEIYGIPNVASPATGEKGYVDVKFSLTTPGGHSSIPPDHTSIGIVSQLVNSLEAHPFSPLLPLESPVFSLLSCAAEHGQLPSSLKKDIKRGARTDKKGNKARESAANEMYKLGGGARYLVTTSQAVDIIKAGVKVNALPEAVELTVNHRVAVGSEIQVRPFRRLHELFSRYIASFSALTDSHDHRPSKIISHDLFSRSLVNSRFRLTCSATRINQEARSTVPAEVISRSSALTSLDPLPFLRPTLLHGPFSLELFFTRLITRTTSSLLPVS